MATIVQSHLCHLLPATLLTLFTEKCFVSSINTIFIWLFLKFTDLKIFTKMESSFENKRNTNFRMVRYDKTTSYFDIFMVLIKKLQTKNNTHVKKVGHISEFLFDVYWWTWKINIYLSKNCWSGPTKNKIILIFTMLHFFKN